MYQERRMNQEKRMNQERRVTPVYKLHDLYVQSIVLYSHANQCRVDPARFMHQM